MIALAVTSLAYIQFIEAAFCDLLLLQSPRIGGCLAVILVREVLLQPLSFTLRVIIFGLAETVLADFVALRVLVGSDRESFERALLILLTGGVRLEGRNSGAGESGRHTVR